MTGHVDITPIILFFAGMICICIAVVAAPRASCLRDRGGVTFPRLGDFRGWRTRMTNHPNRNKTEQERAVIVTTLHRGVFFGYTAETDGDVIKLRAARNCIYWSRGVRGFMGLAATGPDKESRVGPAADIEVRNITSVIECTPDAVKAWEAQPWSR